MGIGNSKEEDARLAAAIQKLSKVEINRIENVFQELSFTNDQGKRLIRRPTWLDRENFAEKFGLPDFLGEQLFAAFDRDQNDVVDLNEFLAGMALCLHGNIKDKCRFLFKIFNLNDDEGISREELSTVLTSSLHSAHVVLSGNIKGAVEKEKGTMEREIRINETVARIVKDAFEKCDISRNDRLEIEEFEHWVHKNAKLINSIFLISCPKPAEETTPYDVITTPEDETRTVVSDEKKENPDVDNRSLSQLFGSQSVPSKDSAGQSFFDSLSAPTVPQLLASQENTGIQDPVAVAKAEISVNQHEGGGIDNDPAVPELSDEILQQHHHQVLLLDEKLVSRNSEMSLVSLGQSTGDLSSLDADVEAQPSVDHVLLKEKTDDDKAEEAVLQLSEVQEGDLVIEAGSEANEDDKEESDLKESSSQLKLDIDLALVDKKSDSPEVASPWHPLKDPLMSKTDKVEDEDKLFQDASDVLRYDTGVDTGMKQASGPVESETTLVPATSDFNPVLKAEPDRTILPSDQSSDDKIFVDITSAANKELIPQTQSSFEEIPEPSIGDEASQRPSTLDVQNSNLTNIDLTPSDHAIGKPTLRQLAEMKEFDKSPSLEDTKSALPEARLAAWLPSVQTRQMLDAVNRGNSVDKAHLTYPSVLLETSLGDPVKDLVAKFLGEQETVKRPIPTADSVTMNDAGLKSLLASQCWRGAVDWSAKYLTAHGQGVSRGSPTGPFNHTPKLLQIWFVRIALLFKLKSFNSAEAELNVFGDFDNPDLYYQYYPSIYPGMKGSMVPFSLRLIHAELPQNNGRPQETLDRLYRLLAVVRTVLENLQHGFSEEGEEIKLTEEVLYGAIQLWQNRETRILYSIGNCLLGIKEYSLAMKIFTEIIQKKPQTKPAILSGVGRLHLQLGDILLAKKYFKKVEQISLGDPKTLSITVMNRGFVALAEGKYDEAYENFQSVTKLDPDNASACNNAAVALLFQGKVKEACTLLETLIWKSPKKNLHEDIIFNLCTVYELETSRAVQKKHKLLDLVSRHKGDGFNAQSLKLT